MGIDKALVYDWFGVNESIFRFVNGIHGDTYDTLMILVSQVGESHNTPYIVAVIALWALFGFVIKKVQSQKGASLYLIRWVAVFAVLIPSLLIDTLVVHTLKEELGMPRPYIALGSDVHVLQYRGEKNNDDYHSFPSGHVSLITILVIALWPALSQIMRWVGILSIALMGWSRMAVGMHFPADILGAFFISLIITVITAVIMSRLLRVLRIRC